MTEGDIIRLEDRDGAQTLRLPESLRMSGDAVRVRRSGGGLVIEPVAQTDAEIDAVLAEIQRLARECPPFMPDGRQQPAMPSEQQHPCFDDLP